MRQQRLNLTGQGYFAVELARTDTAEQNRSGKKRFSMKDVILAWLPKNQPRDDRSSVSRESLQSAITEAVKKADPSCEGFSGVIVQPETPKTRFDANWAIKGVRFGKADREKTSQALATIVERMQREFILRDHADLQTRQSPK
jgi:hypothetical protein